MRGAKVRHIGPVQQQTSEADHQRGRADQAVLATDARVLIEQPDRGCCPAPDAKQQGGRLLIHRMS
jgi:hypothetical protein